MLVATTAVDLAPFHGCALVPTMGALHDGHASLISRAAALGGVPVVATIFVNPTQFAPTEDFAAYPRTLSADLAMAERAGAQAVFVPSVETMYPAPSAANAAPGALSAHALAAREAASWPVPRVAIEPRLEDAFRPTHFGGVCQVVARLFDLTQPLHAFFGEKDYQQLRVLTSMVEDAPGRWPGLAVHGAPTVREPDGLAMSSRNRYLRPEQRVQALGLIHALRLAESEPDPSAAEAAMHRTLHEHGLRVDYAVVRDARTLEPVTDRSRPTRALIAARLDTVRLIDNLALSVL